MNSKTYLLSINSIYVAKAKAKAKQSHNSSHLTDSVHFIFAEK